MKGARRGPGAAAVYGNGTPTKSAVTDLFAPIATVHDEPLAASHPVHPTNTEPSAAVAVKVTVVLTIPIGVLSVDVVKEAFDLDAQLRNVGAIFDRVFGPTRT